MKSLKEKFIKLSPAERLYQLDRPVVALTGGIATGKSTVTKLFRQRGLEIIDADQLVKNIYQQEETKNFIRSHYPDVFVHDEINFPKLRELFFKSTEVKKNVEEFIYQKLPQAFMEASLKLTSQDFYIYDVPLLFEKNLHSKVDLSLVVYAPEKVQLARLIDRDGTKEEIGKKILEQQMSIEEKKIKAGYLIDNTKSMVELAAEVDNLLLQILE
jgi:dephospho-CoA kinase